jgi:hypothetical protein
MYEGQMRWSTMQRVLSKERGGEDLPAATSGSVSPAVAASIRSSSVGIGPGSRGTSSIGAGVGPVATAGVLDDRSRAALHGVSMCSQ